MLAYKGFNSNLQATMGHGTFQFEPGKTYVEEAAKCAKNGFHCAENPLTVFDYYRAMESRFFVVKAAGDINQDGYDTRISCTEITLVKELSRIEMAALGCQYMLDHPKLANEKIVNTEMGQCFKTGDFVVVRGKDPHAIGCKGSILFLVQEKKNARTIDGIYVINVDGEEFEDNTWYGIKQGEIVEWNSGRTGLES